MQKCLLHQTRPVRGQGGEKKGMVHRLQLSILIVMSVQSGSSRAQAGQQSANLSLQSPDLSVRVIHAGLDPGVQAVVVHGAQVGLPVNLGLLGSADDLAGDHDADLTDAGEVGVEETAVDLLSSQGLREGLARGVDHAVGDLDGLGEDGSHTNSGEDVHVVALARVVGAGFAGRVGEGEGLEGGARCEESAAVGVGDGVLKVAFRLGGRVGEGEDDGGRVAVSHLAEDLGSEDTANGGQTHEDGGLDVVDHFLEGLELLALVVRAGKVDLVVSQLVTTVGGNQALGVNQVEARAGLILSHALAHEKVDNLLGDANTGAASTEEHGTVVLAWKARTLDRVDDTTKDDSTSALNIIVEACVGVTVALQSGERVLEVFELDNNTILG